VFVRSTNFPYLKRYAALVLPNPKAEKEGVAGYEITLNYNGVAFALMPRAASEIPGKARCQLLPSMKLKPGPIPAVTSLFGAAVAGN